MISILLGASLLAGLSVYGCFGITQHFIEGIDRIGVGGVQNRQKTGANKRLRLG
jgi:hypothetical protein